MSYVGNIPAEKYSSLTQQTFSSPTGTSFTLSQSVTNSTDIALFVDNVRQDPSTYTAVGTALTTSTISSPSTMYCLFNGKTTETVSPPAGSVDSSHLVAGSVDDSHISGLAASKLTGTVSTSQIAANAVDETKLKDALVADFTEVVVTASDSILLGDATDSGNTKRDTVQGILDLAGGGSWAHIETVVPTTSTHVTFAGTPLSTTYKDYVVYFADIHGASTSKDLYMQVASGVGPTWKTAGYFSALDYRPYGTSTIQVNVANGSQYAIAGASYSGAGMGLCGVLYIHNRANDYVGWTCTSSNNYGDSSGQPGWGLSAGQAHEPNITSLRFHLESGINFGAQGYFALYGRIIP